MPLLSKSVNLVNTLAGMLLMLLMLANNISSKCLMSSLELLRGHGCGSESVVISIDCMGSMHVELAPGLKL